MQFLCLVVQRDIVSAQEINRGLARAGLRPYHVSAIKPALSAVRQWCFDVAMLDAEGFTAQQVFDVLAALRETRVPVVVSLSAPDEASQIRHLEQGATTLVGKPDSLRVTALRLRKLAELRRQDARGMPEQVQVGPLLIDSRRARASIDGVALELSSRQFGILLLLATRAGEFVHRQEFISTARHPGEEGSRSVDMHVSRIRAKLRQAGSEGLAIYTVHSLGYSLCYRSEDSTTGEMLALSA
jgi:DNA-binding response OmpR family regulator